MISKKMVSGMTVMFLFFLSLLWLTGCSNELSRAKVHDLIIKSKKYPKKVTFSFNAWHDLGPIEGGEQYELSVFEKKLEGLGLAKVKTEEVDRKEYSSVSKYLHVFYILSEKGQKLLKLVKSGDPGWGELNMLFDNTPQLIGTKWEITFQQITGITPGELDAEHNRIAEFEVLHENPTELLELANLLQSHNQYQPGKKEKKLAEFQLYDDGWRLNEIE